VARSLQDIVNRSRPGDGQTIACRNCGHTFASYGGRLWCRFCRELIACNHPVKIHGYNIRRDGTKLGKHWCTTCGQTEDARRGIGCGPVLFCDNRQYESIAPCERCGTAEGTQVHHWAPRAIFGYIESDRWPTANLCPSCHSLWHRLMREAAGVRLPPEQRIDDGTAAATILEETA